ncbi:uncharacterized protein LOC111084002 [Limulus polyphemus]|uniref:Uncharacterized protein LOC111084002 n=1 Tax=Limulus polyphemus TaxID=6850 RepID=A0ABM1RYM2_LIMPO|nr:uncharacterized protein LOC111084002 [Limulus polyphemus]
MMDHLLECCETDSQQNWEGWKTVSADFVFTAIEESNLPNDLFKSLLHQGESAFIDQAIILEQCLASDIVCQKIIAQQAVHEICVALSMKITSQRCQVHCTEILWILLSSRCCQEVREQLCTPYCLSKLH